MALLGIRATRLFLQKFQPCAPKFTAGNFANRHSINSTQDLLKISSSQELARRSIGFLTKLTGAQLWQGVVGVSNAGKKRGRGKRVGRKKSTDLNRGQVLGRGKANIVWPGLNAPILKGREILQRKQLPPNPDYEAELVKIREQLSKIRYTSLPPLQRGWSGNRFPGQSVGQPDIVGDYNFEGFDTRVIEFKLVTNMTGTLGRKMRFSAFVVVGNKNGLAGYGLGKAPNAKAAIRLAKNRAAQRLMYIPRFEDHTVYHNMFTQYHKTKIFIHKQERGFGLQCHRAIRTTAELMGIEDLHCNVERGSKNVQAVVKGFFEAVINQETHQELSDRVGLHLVEFRPDRQMTHRVMASPSSGLVAPEPLVDEEEDLEVEFERLYYGGQVHRIKPKPDPPYKKTRAWKFRRAIQFRERRNQPRAQILRLAGLS